MATKDREIDRNITASEEQKVIIKVLRFDCGVVSAIFGALRFKMFTL
jgi:hypothetical protein